MDGRLLTLQGAPQQVSANPKTETVLEHDGRSALWLANTLIGWLRWGVEAWSGRRHAPAAAAAPQPPIPPANEESPNV